MIRVVYSFVTREIKLLFSDKFALFWVLIWPLFWVLMTAYVFIPPGQGSPVRLTIGVVVYDSPTESINMSFNLINALETARLDNHSLFDVKIYENEERLVEDLRKGRLDAGLVIPANFTSDLMIGSAGLEVLIGARDPYSASITRGVLEGFIAEFSRRVGLTKLELQMKYVEQYIREQDPSVVNLIRRYLYGLVVPINASYRDVKPEALSTRERVLGWFVIGAIGMTFLTTGLSEGASTLYREKTIGSLKRILVSPVTPQALIISCAISVITMLLLVAIIVIIGGVLITGAYISFNPVNPYHWLVVVLFAMGAFLSFGLGMILSVFAKTYRSAGSLGVILGLLVSFTTGVWFPKTMLPDPVRSLADYSPFTWIMDAIRGIIVFEQSLPEIAPLLYKALISTIAVIVVDYLVYRYMLRRIIESP